MTVVKLHTPTGQTIVASKQPPRTAGKLVSNKDRQRPILTGTVERALYTWIKEEAVRRQVTASELIESLIELGRQAELNGDAANASVVIKQLMHENERLRHQIEELKSIYEEKEVLEEELARLRNNIANGNKVYSMANGNSAAIVEQLCEIIKQQEQMLQERQQQPGLSEDAMRLRRLVPILLEYMPAEPLTSDLVIELGKAIKTVGYILPLELAQRLDQLETNLLRLFERSIDPNALNVSRVAL